MSNGHHIIPHDLAIKLVVALGIDNSNIEYYQGAISNEYGADFEIVLRIIGDITIITPSKDSLQFSDVTFSIVREKDILSFLGNKIPYEEATDRLKRAIADALNSRN